MKRFRTLLFLLILVLVMNLVATARADGTETLGPVGIAMGTDLVGGGTGLFEQPGSIEFDIPPGASVQQVLLYWNGFHGTAGSGDDTIVVDGIPITGTLIGGPTLFFPGNFSSTHRADVTALGLVGPGTNVL